MTGALQPQPPDNIRGGSSVNHWDMCVGGAESGRARDNLWVSDIQPPTEYSALKEKCIL